MHFLMYHCEQVRQQGEYESIHRDLNIGFGTWEFDPTEIKNPFPENEGSVHIWQGDEDILVPVTLQRYIARPGKRVGSGRVMGQNGFGSKWVRVKTGQLKKGLFWFGSKRVRVKTASGWNGFGSERVRVRTGFGSGRVG
ncbi:hypothetical protein Hdeb2414_s0211g00834281 [Helianthus debilis subsp. tardiflorus]